MTRPFAATLAIVLATWGGGAYAQSAPDQLLSGLADCTTYTAPHRLIVAGLPRDQTALTQPQSDTLRRDVEVMLTASGAQISTARDVTLLRGLLESAQAVSGAQTEALIDAANTGDAVVFITDLTRRDTQLTYRLQAITPDAACKITTDLITTTLTDTGTASVDRIIEDAVANLLTAAPRTTALNICPIVTEAGHSTCAPALTNLLAAAAANQAQNPNRILTGAELSVNRADPASCASPDTDLTHTIGTLSRDTSGDTWLDLQFRLGTQVISALPRTRVDLSALGCDPIVRPLMDHITLTANRDRSRLDLSATPMMVGGLLDVSITIGQQTDLYCWVISPDEQAFVVLPIGDMPPHSAGQYSYPQGFGLRSIILETAFENLFHCFAPTNPLPTSLHQRWTDAGSGPNGPTLLNAPDITTLLDAMRGQPGMAEASTLIVVR